MAQVVQPYFVSAPESNNKFRNNIIRLKKDVPFVLNECLMIERNDIHKKTNLKWRNQVYRQMHEYIPDIFQIIDEQSSKEEKHQGLISPEVFLTRFGNAVQFSRNILEKNVFPKIDPTICMEIVRQEQLETQEDENIIENFVFTLPGLNWILPAKWEYQYKGYIQKKIKIDQIDQEGFE